MRDWRVGSLFTGIGGIEIGFEWAGLGHAAWMVERDPYAQSVLRRHWPTVPIFEDVRDVRVGSVEPVQVLCGGFPCQDISTAGKGRGITGKRSGLWSEFARLVGELGPELVFVENVPALRSRGLDRVLGDLASLGYDAEWDCIPARAVGALHRRDRIFLLAYPHGRGHLHRQAPLLTTGAWQEALRDLEPSCPPLEAPTTWRTGSLPSGRLAAPWPLEPHVRRVAHGIPDRVDRIRCLGNSVVPHVAYTIARAIQITCREGKEVVDEPDVD